MFQISSDPLLAVRHAVLCLNAGHVIAVPTDTVYGLAASAQDISAVKQLYKIKARDESNPIAICVSQVSDVSQIGETSHLPNGLLHSLLPGPVTVILKRTPYLNNCINPGNANVGIRVPNDPFIRNIVHEFGKPIALTSANTSRQPSTLNTEEFKLLWPKLGAVFDAGALTGSRKASTIIDLTTPGYYSVLRDGCARSTTIEKLEKYSLIYTK